jgi:hypothetical protein
VGTNTPLPAGQPIEIAFDRLLLPSSVTRQTFALLDGQGNSLLFSIAYDPVARVVSISPLQALTVGQSYQVSILSESDPTNPSGLHAIDGATMDPNVKAFPQTITFQVVAAGGTTPATCRGLVGRCIDFCSDIKPIASLNCISGTCHNSRATPKPPLGLTLSDPPCTAEAINATAINRLSVEATMGALSDPGPPSSHFGQDMPIIDTVTVTDPTTKMAAGPTGSGDPANSFLIYKLLMAVPTPMVQTLMAYPLTWPGLAAGQVPPLSDAERATLTSYIPGREMPLAGMLTAAVNSGLTIDEVELFSLWIAQGAPLSDCAATPPTCAPPAATP